MRTPQNFGWALVVAALAAVALGPADGRAADKTKVGFVYVGPIGDHGWSYQHHAGLKAVEKAFGDKVKTSYVESVKEGPDAERVIQQMVSSGHKLIFIGKYKGSRRTV